MNRTDQTTETNHIRRYVDTRAELGIGVVRSHFEAVQRTSGSTNLIGFTLPLRRYATLRYYRKLQRSSLSMKKHKNCTFTPLTGASHGHIACAYFQRLKENFKAAKAPFDL